MGFWLDLKNAFFEFENFLGLVSGSFFMQNNSYRIVYGKELRRGYTTGSCAAAAAAAAAEMLLTGIPVTVSRLTLPSGEKAELEITDSTISKQSASCAVVKDGGDDPDVTNGLKVFAKVSFDRESSDISIRAGEGVGTVTREGLQRRPGEPAINPTPVRMIEENVRERMAIAGRREGVKIEISIPGGKEVAQKTYNPRLGIEGGLSILGTTGIVEPMSEKALVDTIKTEIDVRYAKDSEKILITPGNYGSDFCKESLGLDISKAVVISNYIGEALDYIKYKGFGKILLVGHTGKLIKTAAGIMNTHSAYADGRMEIIAAYSAALGADSADVRDILSCITTDQAFDLISDRPWSDELKSKICERAMYHLDFRLKNEAEIEIIMFTTGRDHIIKSQGAETMVSLFREEY